jgi:membrane protein YqaA with SNARE-associated domain
MDLFKIAVLVLSIGLSAVIFYFRKRIAKLASLGYFGLFLASLLGNATILFPAPVFALVIVGGRVLNPYYVGLVTSLGASIGELTGYFAGYGGQALVGEYPQLEEWIRAHGFLTIAALAAIPNPFFDVAGIIAGMNHFPLDQFLLATFLGTCVKYVLLALGGERFLPK